MEGEPDRRAGLALKAMRTGNGLDFECARPPPELHNIFWSGVAQR
jgi:hypothetical protein